MQYHACRSLSCLSLTGALGTASYQQHYHRHDDKIIVDRRKVYVMVRGDHRTW